MLNRELAVYKINKNNEDMKESKKKGILNAVSYGVLAIAGCVLINPFVAGLCFAGAGYFWLKGVFNGVKYSTALENNKELKEVSNLTDKEVNYEKDKKASKKLNVYKINKEKLNKKDSFASAGITLAAAAVAGIGFTIGVTPLAAGLMLGVGIVSVKESIVNFVKGFMHKKKIDNMNKELENIGETQKIYSKRIKKPHVTTLKSFDQLKNN